MDNSQDVEYVRNVIVTHRGTNDAAEQVFGKAKRSWERSPALFDRTFHDFQVISEEQRVGIFSFDLPRVKAVMTAVAHGLAYRDFGRKYIGEWAVFNATLLARTPTPEWNRLREMLASATYAQISTPHPEVFAYGVHRTLPYGFVYRLVFYGGFVVFTFPRLGISRPEVA